MNKNSKHKITQVFAVDLAYSKPIAYALISSGKVMKVGSVGSLEELYQKWSWLHFWCTVIVTEKMYLKSFKNKKGEYKVNAQVALSLARTTGKLEGLFRHFSIEEIMPAHWKKAYKRGADFMTLAKVYANGQEVKTADEADAVLLGLYWWRRIQAKEKGIK